MKLQNLFKALEEAGITIEKRRMTGEGVALHMAQSSTYVALFYEYETAPGYTDNVDLHRIDPSMNEGMPTILSTPCKRISRVIQIMTQN